MRPGHSEGGPQEQADHPRHRAGPRPVATGSSQPDPCVEADPEGFQENPRHDSPLPRGVSAQGGPYGAIHDGSGKEIPMIRMMYFIRKPEDMFIDDFKARWEQHGSVVYNNAAALGIRKYIQATTLDGDPSGELLREIYGLTKEPYDAVGELWWQGRADLADALKTPEGQAAAEAILEDERAFVDWSRSLHYFAADIPQINPPGVIVAREESTILKGYYVAPVHPELTVKQAQYH
ncbi:MAG TPA: hypothetical protein ENK19_10555, partial [Acidobacteria bacterium]|nr:hypothetical protein [Acidobacteriota bacterium]